MRKNTDIQIKEVRCSTQNIDYRAPIKFGGRVVNDVVIFNVEIDVETVEGRRATGFGSMPMGNVWAWPSTQLDASETLGAMLAFAEIAAAKCGEIQTVEHPIELAHELSAQYSSIAEDVQAKRELADNIPKLAQMVAASPLDAALHDAFGRAHQANSYTLLSSEFAHADLSRYLGDEFKGEYLDMYTLHEPKSQMPIYHLVGALDPVRESEVTTPVGDGLPESLADWIRRDGLTHLKIKLAGDDLEWDVARVAAVEEVTSGVQGRQGWNNWYYSLDFNEKCADEEYVLEFLRRLKEISHSGFDRVQYIEQPTHRDLKSYPDIHMHHAAHVKPVVIDESLVDFESLQYAMHQGYSGVALKACKGQTEALLMGAAAQKYGLFLCVQDLTCVGFSFLHSASIAARLPTVAAIEGNGRQYCPAGNAPYAKAYPSMFEVHRGRVGTFELEEVGLGFEFVK